MNIPKLFESFWILKLQTPWCNVSVSSVGVCLCEGGEGGRGSRIWFSGGNGGWVSRRQPECKGVYLIISLECCRASEEFFCNKQNLLVFYYSQFISFCRFQELKIKISRNNQEHDDGNSQDFKQMETAEDNCYGMFRAQKQTETACIIYI